MHAGVVPAAAPLWRCDIKRLRRQPPLHVHACSRRAEACRERQPRCFWRPSGQRLRCLALMRTAHTPDSTDNLDAPKPCLLQAVVALKGQQTPGSMQRRGRDAPAECDAICSAQIRRPGSLPFVGSANVVQGFKNLSSQGCRLRISAVQQVSNARLSHRTTYKSFLSLSLPLNIPLVGSSSLQCAIWP